MKFVGVDLHKKTISLCVVSIQGGKVKLLDRNRFGCKPVEQIARYNEDRAALFARDGWGEAMQLPLLKTKK